MCIFLDDSHRFKLCGVIIQSASSLGNTPAKSCPCRNLCSIPRWLVFLKANLSSVFFVFTGFVRVSRVFNYSKNGELRPQDSNMSLIFLELSKHRQNINNFTSLFMQNCSNQYKNIWTHISNIIILIYQHRRNQKYYFSETIDYQKFKNYFSVVLFVSSSGGPSTIFFSQGFRRTQNLTMVESR